MAKSTNGFLGLAPRRTNFNPTTFRNELEQLPANDVVDVAAFWKAKTVAIKNEMAKSTESALEIGITGATAFGLSYFQGGWLEERQNEEALWANGVGEYAGKAVKDVNGKVTNSVWVEGGKDDPTKFVGIDKTLWATIALGAVTVFNLGGDKYKGMVRSAALGAMATWAGGLGFDLGHTAALEARAAAPAA